jgi:hypothetical protein
LRQPAKAVGEDSARKRAAYWQEFGRELEDVRRIVKEEKARKIPANVKARPKRKTKKLRARKPPGERSRAAWPSPAKASVAFNPARNALRRSPS